MGLEWVMPIQGSLLPKFDGDWSSSVKIFHQSEQLEDAYKLRISIEGVLQIKLSFQRKSALPASMLVGLASSGRASYFLRILHRFSLRGSDGMKYIRRLIERRFDAKHQLSLWKVRGLGLLQRLRFGPLWQINNQNCQRNFHCQVEHETRRLSGSVW